MSGFGSHEIPDWVKDQFNERTALPHGPLAQLPIPVEGHIVGAQSQVPSDGRAARWNVNVVCAESAPDAVRFFEEFLPLSGYELVGVGTVAVRRSWFSRHAAQPSHIVVFRVSQYVGRIIVEPGEDQVTHVEAEMAHCQHDSVRDLLDRAELRDRAEINWRLRP